MQKNMHNAITLLLVAKIKQKTGTLHRGPPQSLFSTLPSIQSMNTGGGRQCTHIDTLMRDLRGNMADAWPTAGKISGTAGQGLHSKAFKILAESRPCPGINGKHAAKAFQQQQIELQRKPRAAKEAKSPGFPCISFAVKPQLLHL